jgi:hypothetical protein
VELSGRFIMISASVKAGSESVADLDSESEARLEPGVPSPSQLQVELSLSEPPSQAETLGLRIVTVAIRRRVPVTVTVLALAPWRSLASAESQAFQVLTGCDLCHRLRRENLDNGDSKLAACLTESTTKAFVTESHGPSESL